MTIWNVSVGSAPSCSMRVAELLMAGIFCARQIPGIWSRNKIIWIVYKYLERRSPDKFLVVFLLHAHVKEVPLVRDNRTWTIAPRCRERRIFRAWSSFWCRFVTRWVLTTMAQQSSGAMQCSALCYVISHTPQAKLLSKRTVRRCNLRHTWQRCQLIDSTLHTADVSFINLALLLSGQEYGIVIYEPCKFASVSANHGVCRLVSYGLWYGMFHCRCLYSIIPAGVQDFSAPILPRPALGLTQPPVSWIPVFFPAGKSAGA